MTGAAGVGASTVPNHGTGPGPSPRAALQEFQFGPKDLVVHPLSTRIARDICTRHHYLGSYPGGAVLNFGISVTNMLLGVAVLGVGQST